MIGPNVKKLIVRKFSRDAIPSSGGIADGIKALTDPNLGKRMKEASEWVQSAIQAVKESKDNPFGDDDEAIAGEILGRIDGDL